MSLRILLFLIPILFVSNTYAQDTGPSIVNIGGGSFIIDDLQMDWNIGESTIIESYFPNPALIITCGVLQPRINKKIPNDTTLSNWGDITGGIWKDTEIQIFPIPTTSIIEINLMSIPVGKISMSLTDNTAHLLGLKEFYYSGAQVIEAWDLSTFTTGTYYIQIALSSDTGILLKQGVFKVLMVN